MTQWSTSRTWKFLRELVELGLGTSRGLRFPCSALFYTGHQCRRFLVLGLTFIIGSLISLRASILGWREFVLGCFPCERTSSCRAPARGTAVSLFNCCPRLIWSLLLSPAPDARRFFGLAFAGVQQASLHQASNSSHDGITSPRSSLDCRGSLLVTSTGKFHCSRGECCLPSCHIHAARGFDELEELL